MVRKRVLISIVALTVILLASSMAALTQALWPWNRQVYVNYNLRQVRGIGATTSMDNSSFPTITVESTDIMISGNITINGHVYNFPKDFTYNSTLRVERNAITGDGIVTAHKVFTFNNLQGKPTLDSWLVTRISGFIFDPVTGAPVNPANMHSSGEFKLTGTGIFAAVDGFGLEQDDHHNGLIKGWPMS